MGEPMPAGLRFITYNPRGERFEKKTPFHGSLRAQWQWLRGVLKSSGLPDFIVTRSPRVLAQLRTLPCFTNRTSLILEWQYPEAMQLWRGWRKRQGLPGLHEATMQYRTWKQRELADIQHADGILYAARDHERWLKQAVYKGKSAWFVSGCVAESISTVKPDYDFGYVGRLAPENGLEGLLEACAGLPQTTLAIVGDGSREYVAELKSLVDRLNITDRVTFSGWVEPGNVREWMQRCRIGIVPISQRQGPEKRQFASPLKLIEWFAAGRPVIASDVACVRNRLGEHEAALLVPSDDARALSKAMQMLREDDVLQSRLSQAGQVIAKSSSFEHRAERMLAFMKSL